MSSVAVCSFALDEPRAPTWGQFALVGLGTAAAAVRANLLVYGVGAIVSLPTALARSRSRLRTPQPERR